MADPTRKNRLDVSGASEAFAVLDLIARAFAPYIARAVKDELRAGADPAWQDQHRSALGPRRHCAACRRRIAEGSGGAEIVGRRCLLTPVAVNEELARSRKRRAAPDEDVRELADKLGLKLVRRGAR